MEPESMGNLKCSVCGEVCIGTDELGAHFRIHEPRAAYACGQGDCEKSFRDKRSMIRHIKEAEVHRNIFNPEAQNQLEANEQAGVLDFNVPYVLGCEARMEMENESDSASVLEEDDPQVLPEPLSIEEELKKLAVETLLELRSTSSLTGKAVERFEKGCYNMVKQFSVKAHENISKSLSERGMSPEAISEVLKDLVVTTDPFDKLRTIDEQLRYFHERFGLVIPQSKFLGSRVDRRLDSKTNSFIPTQVNETFQWISLIENLKLILSNKSIRNKIFKDRVSKDGVLRSYVDGSHFRDHPFLQRHEVVLHILLFYDELEISNSLGSKTIIHKLATFFYQILNLPPEVSSKLSSIYLLVLAHADDLKKPGAMKKVLTLLVHEMKKLSSEEGVEFDIDGEKFCIRAVLVALTADGLAAHEVLGLLATGARHFCRRCMVSRAQVRADANIVGVPRTIETHRDHVIAVTANPKHCKLYGVKRSCPLDKVPYFNCIDNNIFDIFHELLEGVVKLDIKCVLHHYATMKPPKLTFLDLNSKIGSFDFGIPDSKNKPSPNFSEEMLKGSAKISQTGSQMWCLARTLPFLLHDFVQEPDEYLQLIFLLQDAMQIIFAFEVRPEDLERLEILIFKHNELFMKLFINKPQEAGNEVRTEEEREEDFDDSDEGIVEVDGVEEQDAEEQDAEEQDAEEQGAGEPAQGVPKPKKKRKPWKVYVTNKIHQMTHLPEMMRRFGPAVRMWCAKFEGRMKIFRQHASICCNFQNPPKTMAAMFQLSNLKSIITEEEEFHVDYSIIEGSRMKVSDSIHCQALCRIGLSGNEMMSYTNSATLHGEEYRPGLFVCLPDSTLTRPSFAMISDVIVTEKVLYLVTKPWRHFGLNARYNAYKCVPQEFAECIVLNVLTLSQFRCIAPLTVGLNDVFLCMKTI